MLFTGWKVRTVQNAQNAAAISGLFKTQATDLQYAKCRKLSRMIILFLLTVPVIFPSFKALGKCSNLGQIAWKMQYFHWPGYCGIIIRL